MNTDKELQRMQRDAQAAANREGEAMAVFNLNRAGRRMLVVRSADSFAGEGRMVAGPFAPQPPQPRWLREFPDFPAAEMPAVPEGFEDRSWGVEGCPCFIHEQTGLLLWVAPSDHADFLRFTVDRCTQRDAEAGWQMDSRMTGLLETNDWATVEACLPAIIEKARNELRAWAGGKLINVDCGGWHVWQNARGHIVANGPEEWTRHMEWPSARMAIDALFAYSRPLAFAVYKAAAEVADARVTEASDAWNALEGVGSGPMGLTPDAIKFAEPYQRAKAGYDHAAAEARHLRQGNVKRFAKELAAERQARRAAALASVEG